MSTTMMIITGIAILLLIIGASQRKRLTLLFKSEVNSLLENAKNDIKIAKYKIKELKFNINKLIDQSALLYAEEHVQLESLDELKKQVEKTLKKAKKAKTNGNEMASKEKLTLVSRLKEEIDITEKHIQFLQDKRKSIEGIIQKSKSLIIQYDIKVKSLDAKTSVNKVLSQTISTDFMGDSIQDNIKNAETLALKDEFKYDYHINDISYTDEYTDEVEEEFKNL